MSDNTQEMLPGFERTRRAMIEMAQSRPLSEKIEQAIDLVGMYEQNAIDLNEDGYWLAFSGGKDSIVIKEIARLSKKKYKCYHNFTSIDPPELIRYIKKYHAEVEWNRPKIPMMVRLTQRTNGPPTRLSRWCCEEYKEGGGNHSGKIVGVRAAESPRRADRWEAFMPGLKGDKGFYLCPILYWTDQDVWDFIRLQDLPYCELYDEGFKRLGCVGCPLGGPKNMKREFERWPGYERGWRLAIEKYYNKLHGNKNNKGQDRWFEKFGSSEGLWNWWVSGGEVDSSNDVLGCQLNLMWSGGNEEVDDE